MTNHLGDVQNAKAVIMFGANPAVNHPVGFQHFLKAKEKNNAQLIVVDPRFTRTAAKADQYVRVRSGTDIPFMYGMINLIVKNGWHDKKFLDDRVYGFEKVFEEAKAWTPEKVEDVTGVPAEKLIQITRLYAQAKPGCLVWTMGLTQHTIGTSNTRLAPILQMILGNMGVEGGGCNILRGHDNVQGATDLGCLSDSLPGYYGLAEGAWKYFADTVWNVGFDTIKAGFKEDMMNKPGFTLARWYQGVIKEDAIHNGGTDLKALICLGNGITSTSQTHKVKQGLDGLELLVLGDPFVNEAAVLTDKKDNVFILPCASQMETSGSVTATNRSVQWRDKVIDPVFEAKPDQEVMFALAKELGFYEGYVKSLGDGKGNFKWPEDATREISKAIKSIGMTGHTPERLKKHQENWHMFDSLTLEGFGPMKGEYYGLPWPCWTTEHPGSPVLYNTSKPVSKGGMGFRVNWGLEKDGVSLLAGNAPVGTPGGKGHAPVTAENAEALGLKLTDAEKETVKGKSWANDHSGILVRKAVAAGLTPYGNGKARAIVWNFPDHIPLHREPLHSIRHDLAQKYPSFEDKPNFFRVDTRYKSLQLSKDWSKEFPINLVTGRLVTHNGAGVETRASKYLSEINGEMFVDIHPNLAASLGVRDGEMVWVHGPDGGKIKVKAKYSFSVDEKSVFLPFHFMGMFQGEDISHKYPAGTKPYATGEAANVVTNYGYDIITQIPETKGGLCRIEKA